MSALVCLNHVTGTHARGSALVQTGGSVMVVSSTAVKITVLSSRCYISLDLGRGPCWLFFIVKEPIALSKCSFHLSVQVVEETFNLGRSTIS